MTSTHSPVPRLDLPVRQSARLPIVNVLVSQPNGSTLQVSPGIPFEVDGGVVYLSPNSAEGKALQRIQDGTEEADLITVVEAGQEIDTEAALTRLKSRGFKVQIPGSN